MHGFKNGFILLIIAVIANSCVSKVFPDEKLNIDPNFLMLFNSLRQKDTFSFEKFNGNKKVFTITKFDSVFKNEKGWFINEAPYRLLQINVKEIGGDTTLLERPNEIFVNKDPEDSASTLGINFNNLYYFADNVLPPINDSAKMINDLKIDHYYVFESFLRLKNQGDVQVLYINRQFGFLGFKTYSGEYWSRVAD
ncbi:MULTISPECIES: hypothetical protein [Niastella]|uniref:Lipoprotein n=1 Tax=Niastella soli TaxID=2821487 RepID=A0ABS3YYW0_9BACT|nr:hypothetical protein [Niastella soli]MBO9203116.1 hypothetical protein [Niastella soli]